MPEDLDYPMTESERWTRQRWDALTPLTADPTLSGMMRNPDTRDVTVEAVGQYVTTLLRERIRTFAWLELLDRRTEPLPAQLDRMEDGLARMEAAVSAQNELLKAMATGLGLVSVPAWTSLAEIADGDSMGGLERPSAGALGVTVVFEHHRQVPDREHEAILGISPTPGTLVQRGSTVTVSVNLNG
ncbi:MAG TPA: hypothetical protein VIT41_05530 [Microlunatus sp.]